MTYIAIAGLRKKLGGRSRSSIYRDVKSGRLPSPLKIGRLNYWSEDEVDAEVIRIRHEAAMRLGSE